MLDPWLDQAGETLGGEPDAYLVCGPEAMIASVLETLERWMPESESARRWGRVERVTADPLTWSATLRPGAVVLVEGLAMRFGLEGLLQRLGGLTQVPGVRVIADVHGSLAIPRWNFHKHVIDADGKLVDWFASTTSPKSNRLREAIETALKNRP